MDRNRSERWQYAKLTGHKNETLIDKLFNNQSYKDLFAKRLGIDQIISHSIGGINEETVDCALGGKTKSKTDLSLTTLKWDKVNFSIKKSKAGQVYLITLDRFLQGLENIYNVRTSAEEKEALALYFDCTDDNETDNIIRSISHKEEIANCVGLEKYMLRKHRLTAVALEAYKKGSSLLLLDWFKKNIVEITRFCFSSGLSKYKKDWASYIWYINRVEGDADKNMDAIFSIESLCENVNPETISFGKQKGGTTIQLPFGFVQWHQHQIQFHHKYNLISELVETI